MENYYIFVTSINKNRYEPKTKPTLVINSTSHNNTVGINVCIPGMYLFGAKLILLPVFIVSIYIPLKLIFYYFIYMFKEPESTPFTDGVNGDTSQNVTQEENDLILLKKRMEPFHYEYQQEHQQYISQKEKEENEKLCAVLKYTRDTFQQLGFDESEIFQINECVRYFVTNRKVLSIKGIHIKNECR